jgi:hypothetical protein
MSINSKTIKKNPNHRIQTRVRLNCTAEQSIDDVETDLINMETYDFDPEAKADVVIDYSQNIDLILFPGAL